MSQRSPRAPCSFSPLWDSGPTEDTQAPALSTDLSLVGLYSLSVEFMML